MPPLDRQQQKAAMIAAAAEEDDFMDNPLASGFESSNTFEHEDAPQVKVCVPPPPAQRQAG